MFSRKSKSLCFNRCFGNSVSPDHCFYKSFSLTVLGSPPQNLCFNTCFGDSISPTHCFYRSFNCMFLKSFLKNLYFIQLLQNIASLNRYITMCFPLFVLGVATQSHLFRNVFECCFKGFRSLRPPNIIEAYVKLKSGANTIILYVFR